MKTISRQFALVIRALFLLRCCVVLRVTYLFLFVFLNSLVFAELSDEDVRLIQRLIQQNISNIETIRTWSGNGIHKNILYTPDHKERKKTEMKFSFAVDKVQSYQFGYSNMVMDYNILDGKREDNLLPICGIMVLRDVMYRYQARDIKGPGIGNKSPDIASPTDYRGTLIISSDQVKLNKNDFTETLDPFYCCKFANSLPSTYFSHMIKKRPKSTQFQSSDTLSRDNNLLTLRTEVKIKNDDKTLINEYTADISKGGSFTRCKSSRADLFETIWTSELEKVSGVWVPKKMIETVDFGKNYTEIIYTENKINESIPDSMFTLKSLGVRNGDALIDMRIGLHSQVEDESLPELVLPDVSRKSYWLARLILIGFGTILLLSALVRVYLKWRAKRKEARL
jgi:hypothetical protein